MSRKFLRRFVLFALLAAVLLARLPAAPVVRASSGSGEDDYIRNEGNLKLFNASDIQAIAQQYGLQLVEQVGQRAIFLLRTPSSPQLVAQGLAAKILAENPTRVQFAEPNYTSGSPEGSGNILAENPTRVQFAE